MSTLHYADRARNITNKPEINQKITKNTLLKEYTDEIDRLQRELQAARENRGVSVAEKDHEDVMQKLNDKEAVIKALEDQLEGACVGRSMVEAAFASTQKELDAVNQKSEKMLAKLLDLKKIYLEAAIARDEFEFLLAEYEQQQGALRGQAQQLSNVNEKAMENIRLLREKVDRLKTLQKFNKRQVTEFADNQANDIKSMEMMMNSFDGVCRQLEWNKAIHLERIMEGVEQLAKPQLRSAMSVEQLNDVHKTIFTNIVQIGKLSQESVELTVNFKDAMNDNLGQLKEMVKEFVNHQFARESGHRQYSVRPDNSIPCAIQFGRAATTRDVIGAIP